MSTERVKVGGIGSDETPWQAGMRVVSWMGSDVLITEQSTFSIQEAKQLCDLLNKHGFFPR